MVGDARYEPLPRVFWGRAIGVFQLKPRLCEVDVAAEAHLDAGVLGDVSRDLLRQFVF